MGREWCGAGGGLRPQRDRLMPSHGVKVASQEENQRLKIKMQNYKVKIKKKLGLVGFVLAEGGNAMPLISLC